MRVSFLALVAGLILASLPSVTTARADSDILPHSIALVQKGVAAQTANDLNGAIDFYESALVADPRNRSAIVALAQVARAQGLPGKAIGLYREALNLDPNDVTALAGQGEAFAEKGAIDRAKDRLAEVQRLCAQPCVPLDKLELAITAGTNKQMATAEAGVGSAPVSTAVPPISQN